MPLLQCSNVLTNHHTLRVGQTQTLAGDGGRILEAKAAAAVVASCKQTLDRLKVLAQHLTVIIGQQATGGHQHTAHGFLSTVGKDMLAVQRTQQHRLLSKILVHALFAQLVVACYGGNKIFQIGAGKAQTLTQLLGILAGIHSYRSPRSRHRRRQWHPA